MPPPPQRQASGCVFAAFFLMGLGLFVFLAWGFVLPGLRAQFFFEQTPCTILDKRLAEGSDSTWRPEIHIKYQVSGREFSAWTYDAAGTFRSGRASQQAIVDGF